MEIHNEGQTGMNVTVIVQARMGSSRLPGKVMKMLSDRTVLGHVITRCQAVPSVDQIIVATTALDSDQQIVEEAEKYGVNCYRGSEFDVLSRYYEAATFVHADTIIRVTSDCPLLDPELVEKLIQFYHSEKYDYARIGLDCFSRGLDAEIFSYRSLQIAYEEAHTEHDKEHVTPYILTQPERFRIGVYREELKNNLYRLTLDTVEDWQLISNLYEKLYQGDIIHRSIIEDYLQQNPRLAFMNAGVDQKNPTI